MKQYFEALAIELHNELLQLFNTHKDSEFFPVMMSVAIIEEKLKQAAAEAVEEYKRELWRPLDYPYQKVRNPDNMVHLFVDVAQSKRQRIIHILCGSYEFILTEPPSDKTEDNHAGL